MPVVFRVNGFLRSWDGLEKKLDAAGYRGWAMVLSRAAESMRRHGYSDRTGTLSGSMRSDPDRVGGFEYRGSVEANTPYAKYVDEGTRPHVIRAKDGGVLRWFSGDEPVFRRAVFHPGTRPAEFSGAAEDYVAEHAAESIAREMSGA